MSQVTIGKTIPKFSLPATGGLTITQADFKKRPTVLYFYPRDNTPGCTQEGKDFRDNFSAFTQLNAQVFGVSRDTIAAHEKFKAKFEFPFELISDSDEVLCDMFDIVQMKNMYGKQVRGIVRSTFLFDQQGKLCQEWRKVKVSDHVTDVLAALKTL